MIYAVTCQDATGATTTVTVSADTDEKACNAALKTLNTWLAVRALPATIELPTQAPTPAPVPQEEPLKHGRIVHKGTVIDWIDIHTPRGERNAVAEALLAARERVAA